MLMPTLSVTLIGIVVAVVGLAIGRPPPATFVRALAGAWLGFAAGAVPGLIADVLSGSGVYVAVLGHLGAIGGAVVGLPRRAT